MLTTLAIDIGHSATKVRGTDRSGRAVSILFPSVVCPALPIADEKEQQRAKAETIHHNGRAYFFGETAQAQGGPTTTVGLSENWITTAEHSVLLLGAWRKAAAAGINMDRPMVVMGLPTHLFSRQKDQLREQVLRLIEVGDLKVMPQAMGPYHTIMLAEDGTPAPVHHIGSESWGVCDLGRYSADFMLVQKGRWIERASGACAGTWVAAQQLQRQLSTQGITVDPLEAEVVLHTGVLTHYGKRLDIFEERNKAINVVVQGVLDTATRLIEPYASRLDGVVIAGGGAAMVLAALKEQWPHAVLAHDPRFAVAEGFRRVGAGICLARAFLQPTA